MRLMQSKHPSGPMGVPPPRRKSSGFQLEKGIGIDHVKVGMRMCASLAEGIDFPGLKGAAFLAYDIVEIADTVKTNKEDCRAVAEYVWRLIDALVDSSARTKNMVANSRLMEDVNRLGKDLERIKYILQLVASRKLIWRIFYHEADQKQISRCKDMIEASLRVFSVYTGIQLRNDVYELKLRHTSDGDPILTNVQISRVPPPRPRVFVGRDHVVSEGVNVIRTSLAKGAGANIAILGTGGIGKTSLALALLHDAEVQTHFNGKCYFVPCDAITSVSSLIHSILQVLDSPPGAVTDLISALHNCLESPDPMMLILDNFETPWYESTSRTQVESVVARISAIANVTLMLTLRGLELPSEIQWVTLPLRTSHGLPALSPEAAREAFWAHSVAQPAVDPDSKRALDTLLEELSYVPLAVKLVAHAAGKHQTPEMLLKRWRKERNALVEAHGENHDHLTSIDYSITMLVNSPILSNEKDVKQFLALLANLPDGIPDWTKNLELMTPRFPNHMRLADVVQIATLVYPDSSGTLKMLSPIRHHILDHYTLAADHLAALETYYITLVNKHAARSGSGLITAVHMLSPHINNIMSVIRYALRKHPSKVLINVTLKMSYFLYEVRPTCDLLEQMVKVLDVVDMAEMRPVAYHVMGDMWCREGKFTEARVKLDTAHDLFLQAGNENGQGQCLQSLAELCLRESKYSDAEAKIHEALALYEQIKSPLGIAQCQRSLGELLFSSDRYPEARESFENARKKFEKIEDQFGIAQCLRGLGEVERVEDEYAKARELLESAHTEFKKLGNMYWQAQCLKSLADVLLREDKYPEANEKIQEAQTQFAKIRNPLGIAECHQTQAELLQLEDKYLKAKELFTIAYKEFNKIGTPLGAAKCLKSISEILVAEDDTLEARQTLEKAQTLFNKIEKPFYNAQCLQGLGELLGMEEKYPEAEAKLKEAVEQFVQLDNQIGEAQCLKSLGNILQLEDKYDEASQVLERALFLFDDIDDRLGEAQCLRSFAEILRLQEKYPEAHVKVQESYERSQTIGDILGVAQSLQVLGEILRMEGKVEEAKSKLLEALNLFNDIGDAAGAEQVDETLLLMKEGQ